MNIVLLACSVLLFGRYAAVYQERLREENLGNIANLNQSAAGNAAALIDSWNIKLADVAQYVEHHGLTVQQALAFIEDSNASGERYFELVGGDYTGYLAQRDASGAFIPLSYETEAYGSLQKVIDDTGDKAFTDVCFAPEFTDGATALKYFAIYKHVALKTPGGMETYALLLATESPKVLAAFNNQTDFTGQSTVLVDARGNYIVSNSDFKSTNFFQYLYVYNDLTLDERNGIQHEMEQKSRGEIYYQNAAGEDSVFRYERMTTNDWYCVTCVPLSSFRTPVLSINYALYAVIALLLMLGLDMLWLRQMNKRLLASILHEKEASEAKTDFLSRMSHDIRTPLNGIIGLTALAREEKNPPRTAEYLENINVSGKFLLGLVNDILDMSKVERGLVELHPEPYTGKDLCRYVEAVVSPLCKEKKIEFFVNAPREDTPVLLDRLRFNQVIFNLLSNAVKYTPVGGRVELSWTRTVLPGERAALDFCVSDNGIGMSEAFQSHMFEAFAQEHSSAANAGTGLGLSIVHSLVGLMGGQIVVTSRQGEGTTFRIHLETDVCRDVVAEKTAVKATELQGKHVLLCEDNAVNILFARRLMEKWGLIVDTAEDGCTGLAAFSASAPGEYDAILMDVMMPNMNGLEATRAIRALERPDAASVPIIAMTANAYDMDVKNCLDAGMNEHLGKPIDPEQFRTILAGFIGG